MPDRPRLDELIAIAPAVDLTVLRIIAALLAGEASSDALFLVADALRARATELRLEDHHRLADQLSALEPFLMIEATRRARRGSFW